MTFEPRRFDIVTMLEVLEYLETPQSALKHVVALANRYVAVSVPSVPDDNPEHLLLFSPTNLERMRLKLPQHTLALNTC